MRAARISSEPEEPSAVGQPGEVLGDRGRLVLLEEVLGRDGLDVLESRCKAGLLAVNGKLERRIVGAPHDLHGIVPFCSTRRWSACLSAVCSNPRMMRRKARPPLPERRRSR